MHPKIAICDDSKIGISFYLDALRARNYDVLYFQKTEQCQRQLEAGTLDDCDMFIVDVVFEKPHYHFPPEECRRGALAGLSLAWMVRRRNPEIAILIFSGAPVEDILTMARNTASALNTHNWQNAAFLPKSTTVEKFADFVSDYFDKRRFPSSSWLTSFFEKLFGGRKGKVTIGPGGVTVHSDSGNLGEDSK